MMWTEELTERLKLLWPSHTASEIAAIFSSEGHHVSRNAVIGRAHRTELEDKTRKPSKPRQAPEPKPRIKWPPKPIAAPRPQPAPFIPRTVETGPIRHLTLLELTDDVCKYECSGQGDVSKFTFCGRPVSKAPYCAEHYKGCHEKWSAPTKQKPFFRRAS